MHSWAETIKAVVHTKTINKPATLTVHPPFLRNRHALR